MIDVSVDAQEECEFLEDLDDEEDLEVSGHVSPNNEVCEDVKTVVEVDVHNPTDPLVRSSYTIPKLSWKSVGRAVVNQSKDLDTDNDFDRLRGNPAFERYLQKRLSEEDNLGRKKQQSGGRRSSKTPVTTPKKFAVRKDIGGSPGVTGQSPLVKSPSDMTIYVPAIQRPDGNILPNGYNTGLPNAPITVVNDGNDFVDQGDVANQISDFIQGIRIQSEVRVPQSSLMGDGKTDNRRNSGPGGQPSTSGYNPHIQAAKDKAERLILDAEQHRAVVNSPPGMMFKQLQPSTEPRGENVQLEGFACQQSDVPPVNQLSVGKAIEDDNFFHVSCHVDSALKGKIQRG